MCVCAGPVSTAHISRPRIDSLRLNGSSSLHLMVCAVQAMYVPGWFYGPHKKLDMVRTTGGVYMNPEDKDEDGKIKPWLVSSGA